MKAGTKFEAEWADCAGKRQRATDGARRPVEKCEDSITSRTHFATSVAAKLLADSSARSGYRTIRARIAAVLGRPTPMNTDWASVSRRAATTVWTSPAVNVARTRSRRRHRLDHVLAHPLGELLTVAAELVPEAVEVVVARR